MARSGVSEPREGKESFCVVVWSWSRMLEQRQGENGCPRWLEIGCEGTQLSGSGRVEGLFLCIELIK